MGNVKKEYQLEQQNKHLEQHIVYLVTQKLESCENEREIEKRFAAQSTKKIEEEKKLVEIHFSQFHLFLPH